MIPIQNIYYMLTYAFKTLSQSRYKRLSTEEFENTADLFAAILVKGISIQIKRGLGREYIPQTSELSAIRGKIDIEESIKTQSLIRKKLTCNYDEFSVDNDMNRIIKSTIHLLIKSDISKYRKKELRKILLYFSDVKQVDILRIKWDFTFNRNNQTYKMLISICYLTVKGFLQTNRKGKSKLMDFLDEQRMSRLYEKFILEYYKKHFPLLSPSASQIPWAIDDGVNDMLPVMQTDIHLQKENTVLIIDAKYYTKSTQVYYGKRSIHSNNLYQIFTYVKNREYQLGDRDKKVSGLILYAKTDEIISPDHDYQMHGNKISVKTLDLDGTFDKIAYQLDNIVLNYFKEIKKV